MTAAVLGAGYGAARLATAHAETKTLRARAELARAVATLAPGTEISGTGRGGIHWHIRVPAAPAITAGDGA
ncbi:hypothetical protein [Phytohabitans houttuyneae]|uniref:hypothetical protein n=1 Tax=Phytohabitans houttuyneae TaxID=1076126 RepID=UPI001C49B664|nr:hypothetical protein [Phytohabitans houttuyneae]